MRLVGLWTIVALSFLIAHDIFLHSLPLPQSNASSLCHDDESSVCEPTINCETHNLLHFIAILESHLSAFDYPKVHTLLSKNSALTLSTIHQTPYRPPIL